MKLNNQQSVPFYIFACMSDCQNQNIILLVLEDYVVTSAKLGTSFAKFKVRAGKRLLLFLERQFGSLKINASNKL